MSEVFSLSCSGATGDHGLKWAFQTYEQTDEKRENRAGVGAELSWGVQCILTNTITTEACNGERWTQSHRGTAADSVNGKKADPDISSSWTSPRVEQRRILIRGRISSVNTQLNQKLL
ncbi:hypothetical protein WMY93_026119 [Mugilogobius chulae]|uniref:Uncharacterized protein n=1 Tax=Mugilogobius chulae TaxID=88201 RepID=A0AAW0N6L2_9GOBI